MEYFIGRDKERDEILKELALLAEYLKESAAFSISFVGHTGIGKSTLLKRLLNSETTDLSRHNHALSARSYCNSPLYVSPDRPTNIEETEIEAFVRKTKAEDLVEESQRKNSLGRDFTRLWTTVQHKIESLIRKGIIHRDILLIVDAYIDALVYRHLRHGNISISYIVSSLHRIFYIPHSTLHMPKNTDEDHSIAYNPSEPMMGMLCLLPAF